MASNPDFGPSCPSESMWYACGNGTEFVGCCVSYPCDDIGCFPDDLQSASFVASYYGQFPDQECSDGDWYTCQEEPNFLGCCKSNPCSPDGCPVDDLAAGYLSDDPTIANAFDPYPPLQQSSNSTSSTSTISTSSQSSSKFSSSSSSTTSPSSTTTPVKPSTKESIQIGAIAGGAAGGMIILLTLLFIVWRWQKHMAESRSEKHRSFQVLNARKYQYTPAELSTAHADNNQTVLKNQDIKPSGNKTFYSDSLTSQLQPPPTTPAALLPSQPAVPSSTSPIPVPAPQNQNQDTNPTPPESSSIYTTSTTTTDPRNSTATSTTYTPYNKQRSTTISATSSTNNNIPHPSSIISSSSASTSKSTNPSNNNNNNGNNNNKNLHPYVLYPNSGLGQGQRQGQGQGRGRNPPSSLFEMMNIHELD